MKKAWYNEGKVKDDGKNKIIQNKNINKPTIKPLII